ncbi:uncharacterized protein B0I36DRAFT_356732 [Microdochium trichocladiopsis]|uniref:Uncharacterized protein n=1 Tax=Microdochium trichocladiopsis TaxID=1682393 RepID=A0A9P9BEW1_9PEZI|nr:uncharacterized protein B0I36DRAFT_356732 [Microdochium trichocladiopsis]KAH7009235.1 hypothetical protein B0I36DRAFT_356732 [Microdochium trichocladiopsis]
MSKLREFGTIVSGNRQKCQDFTPEQRAFILGAAGAGAKHAEIAEALGTKRQRVGEQIMKATKRRQLASKPRQGRPSSRNGAPPAASNSRKKTPPNGTNSA